eukprot:Nitzschia sp. Nitz4//scaffold400_size11000//5384//6148//NITZ4_009054-RA/size11000-processed-gene-0.0-mRNA-1//1//CDS//3329551056//452//frame0
MALNAFLGTLMEENAVKRDSIVVIHDNAQLTEENRLHNSESFASMTSPSSDCHLASRWNSQPILSRRSSGISMASTKPRRSSLMTVPPSRSKNASWDNAGSVRGGSGSHEMNFLPCPTRPLQRSSTSVPVMNPLLMKKDSRASLTRSTSNTVMPAGPPKLPNRVLSPQGQGNSQSRSLSSASLGSRSPKNILDLPTPCWGPEESGEKLRSSSLKSERLRQALGSMAPARRTVSSGAKPSSRLVHGFGSGKLTRN